MKYTLLIEGDKGGEATIYGPFDTYDDAIDYGDEILHDEPWVVIDLREAKCNDDGDWIE